MLICPNCNFSNKDSNKFCEKCGTSLIHISCRDCGAEVAFNRETCQVCGAKTGAIYLAIVQTKIATIPPKSSSQNTLIQPSEISPNINVQISDDPNIELLEPANITPRYLDKEQRYQIISELENRSPNDYITKYYKVLDLHPFKTTTIQAFNNYQTSPLDKNKPLTTQIPDLAKIYLELGKSDSSTIPKLHEAWFEEPQEIFLVEYRQDLTLLGHSWNIEEIPLVALISYFGKMAKLWNKFTPYQLCSSLLEDHNLYLDEDQNLVLQILIWDSIDHPPELKDLGRTWKQILEKASITLSSDLIQFFNQMIQGEVTEIDHIQDQFQTIIDSIEPSNIPNSEDECYDSSFYNQGIEEEYDESDEEDLYDRDDGDTPTMALPMQLTTLDDAGYSDIGTQRNHNEDTFGIEVKLTKQENPFGRSVSAQGLYVLCDGMGGHAGGEIASATAVKNIKSYFQTNWETGKLPDTDCIRDGILTTNQVIYDINQETVRTGSARMGTTLVMVLIQDTQFAVAHVGDSRLYRVTRKRGLEQLTTDHEVGQREILRGVEPTVAYGRPDAYQLTQALGPRDNNFLKPEVQFFEINEDMLLILASDGLTDNDLLENHWQTHLSPLLSSRANLDQGVQQLMELANQHNGHDNITAILIRAKVKPNLEMQRF